MDKRLITTLADMLGSRMHSLGTNIEDKYILSVLCDTMNGAVHLLTTISKYLHYIKKIEIKRIGIKTTKIDIFFIEGK